MATIGQYGERFPTMTADEIALVAAKHLLEQGKRSYKQREDGRCQCLYDGNGVCCAAAPFIKDYRPEMEGKGWEGLVNDFDQPSHHVDLIETLQYFHDKAEPEDWLDELTERFGNDEYPQTKDYLESIHGEEL